MNSKSRQKIAIQSFAGNISSSQGTVVIIDVFRAFSMAAYAFQNGAKEIIMLDDVDQAIELKQQGKGRFCMGERGGDKPDAFDFGNSPAEIQDMDFTGETLIQTTSNGTRGLVAAESAQKLYAASFVNARETANQIRDDKDIFLVAMGEKESRRCEEDELCALYIRSLLWDITPDVSAITAAVRTLSTRIDGRRISNQDVSDCLAVDSVPLAINVSRQEKFLVACPRSC